MILFQYNIKEKILKMHKKIGNGTHIRNAKSIVKNRNFKKD